MSKNPFTLELKTEKNGIYLSQQQVDLLTIVSLKDKEDIVNYIEKRCGQFPNKKAKDVVDIEDTSIKDENVFIEKCKRQLFEKYRDTLVTYLENDQITIPKKVQSKLEKMGLNFEESKNVMDIVNQGNVQRAYAFLEQQYGREFVEKFNHFIFDDFENIKDKSIDYDTILKLDKQIKDDSSIDTIIIATGKYDNSVFPTGHGEEFVPYFTMKGLEYCKSAGKHMRYHALWDNMHLQKLIHSGKNMENHDEILDEMKKFIESSMKFINENNEQMNDGTMRINVIEVFNELVEYNKAEDDRNKYEMAWEKYFGITIDEIMTCFDGIEKPEGVTYMYNETMLEESQIRRDTVENVVDQIIKISPEFLDKFGTQMHIEQLHAIPKTEKTSSGKLDQLEQSFKLLEKIQNKGLGIECTEFDIHIDFKTMEKVIKDESITNQEIYDMKRKWMSDISKNANKRNIKFIRTTYWSLLDGCDHNLVRANKKRQRDGKQLFETMYAGLYGNGEYFGRLCKKEKSIKELENETLEEQMDIELLDKIELKQKGQDIEKGPQRI